MLRTANFGRKALAEIKEVLAQIGLRLGVEISGWPPDNVEEFSKQFQTIFFKKVDELDIVGAFRELPKVRQHNLHR